MLPFFPFVVVLFYFVSNQWHFKCLYSGVNKQLQWLIRLRRREENLNRRGHLQWVRKYGFFSRADVSVSKSIDRAGGGNTGEQWYRLLGRRKTIRVACEWETWKYGFVLGGLFSSNLGRGVSGEIKTEAFKIEAAEDLDSSAKGNVSLGEMELERLKVHIFCPQQFFFKIFPYSFFWFVHLDCLQSFSLEVKTHSNSILSSFFLDSERAKECGRDTVSGLNESFFRLHSAYWFAF